MNKQASRQTHSVTDILNFYGRKPPLPAHLLRPWAFLSKQYDLHRTVHIICDARLLATLIVCIKSKYIAMVTTVQSHTADVANSTQSSRFEVKIIMNETISVPADNVVYINCKIGPNVASTMPTIHL